MSARTCRLWRRLLDRDIPSVSDRSVRGSAECPHPSVVMASSTAANLSAPAFQLQSTRSAAATFMAYLVVAGCRCHRARSWCASGLFVSSLVQRDTTPIRELSTSVPSYMNGPCSIGFRSFPVPGSQSSQDRSFGSDATLETDCFACLASTA